MASAKKGFTLIELLIVIVIIGILAMAGFATYSIVQPKARDAKRKHDFDVIRKNLEFYKSEHGGLYPETEWVYSTAGGFWIPGLDSNYLNNMPTDPKNTTGCFTRDDSNCFNYGYYSGSWCGLNGREYILAARFEAYKGSDLSQQQYHNSNGTNCSLWSESSVNGLYVLDGL